MATTNNKTSSLVSYVKDIKPYRTKLKTVCIQLNFEDKVDAAIHDENPVFSVQYMKPYMVSSPKIQYANRNTVKTNDWSKQVVFNGIRSTVSLPSSTLLTSGSPNTYYPLRYLKQQGALLTDFIDYINADEVFVIDSTFMPTTPVYNPVSFNFGMVQVVCSEPVEVQIRVIDADNDIFGLTTSLGFQTTFNLLSGQVAIPNGSITITPADTTISSEDVGKTFSILPSNIFTKKQSSPNQIWTVFKTIGTKIVLSTPLLNKPEDEPFDSAGFDSNPFDSLSMLYTNRPLQVFQKRAHIVDNRITKLTVVFTSPSTATVSTYMGGSLRVSANITFSEVSPAFTIDNIHCMLNTELQYKDGDRVDVDIENNGHQLFIHGSVSGWQEPAAFNKLYTNEHFSMAMPAPVLETSAFITDNGMFNPATPPSVYVIRKYTETSGVIWNTVFGEVHPFVLGVPFSDGCVAFTVNRFKDDGSDIHVEVAYPVSLVRPTAYDEEGYDETAYDASYDAYKKLHHHSDRFLLSKVSVNTTGVLDFQEAGAVGAGTIGIDSNRLVAYNVSTLSGLREESVELFSKVAGSSLETHSILDLTNTTDTVIAGLRTQGGAYVAQADFLAEASKTTRYQAPLHHIHANFMIPKTSQFLQNGAIYRINNEYHQTMSISVGSLLSNSYTGCDTHSDWSNIECIYEPLLSNSFVWGNTTTTFRLRSLYDYNKVIGECAVNGTQTLLTLSEWFKSIVPIGSIVVYGSGVAESGGDNMRVGVGDVLSISVNTGPQYENKTQYVV